MSAYEQFAVVDVNGSCSTVWFHFVPVHCEQSTVLRLVGRIWPERSIHYVICVLHAFSYSSVNLCSQIKSNKIKSVNQIY